MDRFVPLECRYVTCDLSLSCRVTLITLLKVFPTHWGREGFPRQAVERETEGTTFCPGSWATWSLSFLLSKMGSMRMIPTEWWWGGSCFIIKGYTGDDDDDDGILELVEVQFCREGGRLRPRMGSGWLKVTQGITSRAGIPGKFSRTNSRTLSSGTTVPELWAGAPWSTTAASQESCKMFLIVKVILAILGISQMSHELLAWGHSQFQH